MPYHSTTPSIDLKPENIPAHEMERLISPLPDIIERYFAQPGVQEKFETWLEERKRKESGDPT